MLWFETKSSSSSQQMERKSLEFLTDLTFDTNYEVCNGSKLIHKWHETKHRIIPVKEFVIGIRLSSHHVEKVDTQKVKNDVIDAMYT